MKSIQWIFGLALIMSFNGCSSPESVSTLQGHGTKTVYNASYDRVWSAAIAASQTGDLYVLNADKSRGYISTKRGWRPTTFGENVGIWVRSISPTQTEVEVVSKQAGPPVLVLRNWETRLLDSIAANLTAT
ncbi:hypothetical protein [Pedosphaera parvula]|uniref:Lipoprotein n=1 Tax=Pedosphaera parvula (strain Ellin514) TaxID=320771 RepID=B9XSZ4_PEDPL|nr:hypothetical protein [Pedosphaera parvula]EEF57029.1 hypothetical protein Cflav_PD0075 [Pedosphaera parvula Ellin514]